MPNIECFRDELKKRFRIAEENKWSTLIVRSGPLHNDLAAQNLMPMCCGAMRGELRKGDSIIEKPPQGNGAHYTVEYRIPRPGEDSPKGSRTPLMSEQDFSALWRQKLPEGTQMDNLSGDNVTTIVDQTETKVFYQRGDSNIRIAFADLYWGYQQIHSAGEAGLTTKQLKEQRPMVFDSSHRPAGHSCNCTFLFQGLEELGLVELQGFGVKGSPFIAFAR